VTAKILADDELRKRLVAQGFDVLPISSPAEFSAQIAADIARWVPIVRASGATVD
jgi:tripartite-type tricarboxylate transporter receptor subunit TctC